MLHEGTKKTEKAYVYVTCRGQLLVFSHSDHPGVGYQVPGGSIRQTELPAEAASRELFEEAGLAVPSNRLTALGTYEHDMSPFRHEVQRRHLFHVDLNSCPSQSWQHSELHDGRANPERLSYRWIPLGGYVKHFLSVGQGELVECLLSGPVPLNTDPPERLEYGEATGPITSLREDRSSQLITALQILGIDVACDHHSIATSPLKRALLAHTVLTLKDLGAFENGKADWVHAASDLLAKAGGPFACVEAQTCRSVRSAYETQLFLWGGSDFVQDVATTEGARWALSLGMGETLNSVGLVIFLQSRSSNEATNSYTLRGIPDTVYVDRVDDSFRMGEILLHESTHNWLNDACDALGVRLDPTPTWWSPWRRRNRPASGIVHAAFVFSRLVQYYDRGRKSGRLTAYQAAYASAKVRVEANLIRQSLATVRQVAEQITSELIRDLLLEEVNRALSVDTR